MWDEIDFPTALLKTHSIEMALYKHTYISFGVFVFYPKQHFD